MKASSTKLVYFSPICLVVYGNRVYDDALRELKDILIADGCNPIAVGAFIGEHCLSSDKTQSPTTDLTTVTSARPKHLAARSIRQNASPVVPASKNVPSMPERLKLVRWMMPLSGETLCVKTPSDRNSFIKVSPC